jgi:ribosomal protein S27E
MKVRCPKCRQVLLAPDEAAGRKVRCQGCRTTFYLAKPDATPTQSVGLTPGAESPPLEPPPLGPPMALQEDAPEASVRCPICGARMDAALSVCAQCGFNRRTGKTSIKHLRGRAVEEAEEGPEKVSFALLVLQFIGELLPGLFRPGLLIGAIILSLVGFAVLGLAMFLIGLGAILSGMSIGGAGLVVYAQALGILLYGQWAFLPECLAECNGRRWLAFLILLVAPFATVYLLIRPYLPA